MTQKFSTVIKYGFYSHLAFVLFQIYKSSQKSSKGQKMGQGCLEFIVTVGWLAQFITMITYRFSHTGRVCSGDYSSLPSQVAQTQYNIYYQRQEGDFFYYYCLCSAIAVLVFLALACCIGTILFMGGSFSALKFAESMIENAPNMMSGGPPPPSD